MMILRSGKRIRSSEEDFERDRLSELPDDVILHILSCMPIIDAVRTVLLRRFGNLWTLVHTLEFEMNALSKNFCKPGRVNCFISNVLMLHQNLSIDRFHLMKSDSRYATNKATDDLTMCLRFALDRQAKEIRVSYKPEYCFTESDYSFSSSSILPELTSQFLVTLDLVYFEFEVDFQVKLESLKKLSLERVRMNDAIFQRFISGCPSLQELVIVNPVRMTKLSFSAPNIVKLSLFLTADYRWNNPPSLYMPNLKSLYLDIDDSFRVDIIDVSSVRDINIKYSFYGMLRKCYDPRTSNKMLVQKFEGAEVFRLSRDPSCVFLVEIRKFELVQCRWKRIILELEEFGERFLLGIYHLMRSLKHMEELVLYTMENFSAYTNLLRVEFPSPYVTPQLKIITMHGYWKSWKGHLRLIEFLLKGATVLDKLVIVLKKRGLKEAEELEFVKQVLSFPKASPSARVIFA